MADFLTTARGTVVETAAYLWAYRYVLVLAPLAHLGLLALAPRRRGWLGEGRGPWVAAVVGLTEPLSRAVFEDHLRRFGSPGAAVTYLGVSHAMNVYVWVFLGPLLGKDFLLSHGVGVGVFVLFAAGLARWAPVGPARAETLSEEGDMAKTLARAVLRFAGLAALGLGLGGLVAAWGLSSPSWAPAELGAGGGWTQLVNAGLGVGLALFAIPPVANLFVVTYLWKVGLAHAGVVAFLCAAPAAPTRWGIYARLYGRPGALRLILVLLAAALLAGLATAGLFGALDLTIRYKLLPEQLWRLS